MQKFIIITCLVTLCISGCEGTDFRMATEAGRDAVKAITLSDEDVMALSDHSAKLLDSKHKIAGQENKYAKRLDGLVRNHKKEEGLNFDYKAYIADEVNAFALGNGTIRIYSGLMDMLNDGELLFVIGHEVGHVVKAHIRKKIQLAYAASAVRKGIASQNTIAGELALSQLGDFVNKLVNAQFSQFEEKEADDFGLSFLKRNGYDPKHAVSALRKLATLGNDHSFLASHPAPGKRADRLESQLEGRALSIEETKEHLVDRILSFFQKWFSFFYSLTNP